jgi:hypothetical protein
MCGWKRLDKYKVIYFLETFIEYDVYWMDQQNHVLVKAV